MTDTPRTPDPDPKTPPPEPADADMLPAEPVRESDWEAVLQRAEDRAREENPETAGSPAAPALDRWRPWLRAAIPLLIVVVYAGWKIVESREGREGEAPPVEEVSSLSGVKPSTERIDTTRELRELLGRLENLQAADDWTGIRAAVGEAPQELQADPRVTAFSAIATVFEGGFVHPDDLQRLRRRISGERDARALSDYLRLAEADVLVRTAGEAGTLISLIDEFRTLVGDQPRLTPEVMTVRMKLARRYEMIANQEYERATSGFRPDRTGLATARSLYQQALRWLTTPEGWMPLRPISEGEAAVMTDRIVLRLREANRSFHGPDFPWDSKDSETWTGREGEPVHDAPGGRW